MNIKIVCVLALISVIVLYFSPLNGAVHQNLSPEKAYVDTYGGAYCVFANKFGGEISKKDLLDYNELEIFGCAAGSKIFEYTLVITKNEQKSTYQGKLKLLTDAMLAKLRSLSAGDEFIFNDMRAHLPNSNGNIDVTGKKFVVVDNYLKRGSDK